MSDHQQQSGRHRLPQQVSGPPYHDPPSYTATIKTKVQGKQKRSTDQQTSSANDKSRRSPSSPPAKKSHTISDSDSDHSMEHSDYEDSLSATTSTHSFLLTKFDPKFQNPKLLLLQFLKYVPRDIIIQIIPTRNGIIIKSTEPNLATKIRDKHSLEIFGPSAQFTRLDTPRQKHQPPPRRPPILSVVIRGVNPELADDEIQQELTTEGHIITKCIRIKTQTGTPSYMVRILTSHSQTITDLLSAGAYIYRRRYRVEPSRSQPPLPTRCEHCQTYNDHPTSNCPNTPKCGYCTGPHTTKDCSNLNHPPKCNTCGKQHPTYSYKCKNRPEPTPENPGLVLPLRPPEPKPCNPPILSPTQPITIDQFLSFITITLQNLYPFQKSNVLTQLQFAARTVLNINLQPTYSGPYIYVHTNPLETTV